MIRFIYFLFLKYKVAFETSITNQALFTIHTGNRYDDYSNNKASN